MAEVLPVPLATIVIALAALVLYVIAWRVARHLTPGVKLTARMVLVLVALAPVGGIVLFTDRSALKSDQKLNADADQRRARTAPESAPPPPAQRPVTRSAAPPASKAPPPATGGAEPAPQQTREPDFSVVPVFFGTDRKREEGGKRIAFAAERARRLEMGRAMVSVPRDHKVPDIERPWTIRVPFTRFVIYEEKEDPKKHFTIQEIRVASKDEMLDFVRRRLDASQRFKDQAFIFVHGYNTTFDNAVYRTAQLAYDLNFDGAPFLYSWPSGGGVASYIYDRESSAQAQPYLKEFMEMVLNETRAKNVNVIAHSMGNQPLLAVLREIRLAMGPNAKVRLNQIILAAPDVDRDVFLNVARDLQGLSNGVTLYASSTDRAMIASRTLTGIPRAGDVPSTGPIVLPGIDTIDVTQTSTDTLALNHSGYAEKEALLNDIALLIRTGERPPEKRIPILQKVNTSAGVYWRYPPR